MKIISLSNRRKGLTAILFQDGSECLIDSELVSICNLKDGSVVEDLNELKFESDCKRAKSRALWYLSRADHSKKALWQKLIKGGFSKEAVDSAVERMEELGLLDDEKLAIRLTEYYLSQNMSRKEAYHKLLLKGIQSSLAKEIVFCHQDDETEKIKDLISVKYASKLEGEENVKKVYAALVRKGFSFTDIRKALREYSEELENSEEDYGV